MPLKAASSFIASVNWDIRFLLMDRKRRLEARGSIHERDEGELSLRELLDAAEHSPESTTGLRPWGLLPVSADNIEMG
jgi:hypothetical protein